MNGKKTYLVGILTIVFAGLGIGLGKMTWEAGSAMISTALLAMGLRHGISNSTTTPSE